MENQMETETKKMIKKEKEDDRFSTIANAGDRKNICNKKFATSCELKRHKSVHFGDKPYKCPTENVSAVRTVLQDTSVRSMQETQMESRTQEVDTKEEVNDGYITVSNAGDRREPSVQAMRSKDSVKEEISLAEVENTDCQDSAKPDKEPNKPTSSCTVVKEEEISDVLGTMVFAPEMSLSNLYCPSSTPEESETNKIQEVGWAQFSKAREISVGAFVDMPVSRATNKVADIPASSFISASSLKVGNKVPIKRDAMIQSSPFEMKSNRSTLWTAPARTTTSSAASPDPVANKHSIRESESDHDDGCSKSDADMKETGLSNQHCVENSTNDAKGDCDGGQFNCLDCAAAFETDAAFKTHIASHEGYRRFKCTVCEKRFPSHSHLLVHMRGHTGERQFGCNICDKKYTTNGHLTVHKRIHAGVKAFKCDVCEKCFTHSGHLNRHRRIHTGERLYKCDTCERKCTSSSHLVEHTRIHTGERPFVCPTCQKRFARSGDLRRHTLCHTGEKPFQCDVCEKGFARPAHLKEHQLIHTEKKLSFECPICQNTFTHRGSLQQHICIHTGEKPFKCDVCGKCFTQSGQLTVHKRIHTGEKPFKCDICDKGFAHGGDLQRHKYVHSGEKPYICETCGQCFSHNWNLKTHNRRQHAGPDAGSQPNVSHLNNLPSSSPQADASRESSPMEEIIIID